MTFSPGSHASSSDLYSNPERAQEDASRQLVGGLSADQGYGSNMEQESHIQASEEAERLPESYTNGSIESLLPGGMNPQVPHAGSIANGEVNPGHMKRKREDGETIFQNTQKHLNQLQRLDQDSSRTVSLEPVQYPMTNPDSPPQDDRSRTKRPKTESQVNGLPNGSGHSHPAGLPTEIWQHVFSFVPPVFLGRLLRVNRAFNSYLTAESKDQSDAKDPERHAIGPVGADDIWAASRKRFAPGLPRPSLGLTELQRWRLLRGRQCQICGDTKVQNFATSSESPLESGPGEKGVRVIWPFGIRCCGPCLHKCSEKVQFEAIESCCELAIPRANAFLGINPVRFAGLPILLARCATICFHYRDKSFCLKCCPPRNGPFTSA